MDCMLGKAIAYRVLIHLVGDVHQPFHAIQRYTKDYPNGDFGGNKFKIIFTPVINNLHFLWDAILGLDSGDPTSIDVLKKNATNYMKEFPTDHYKELIKEPDVDKWVNESAKAAMEWGYQEIKENTAPTPQYLKTRAQIAKERITLAGYRMAYLLETIYNHQMSSTADEEEQNE